MLKNFFITLFVLLLTSSLSYALDDQGNENDPTVNERANACYEGGSMEGKCDTDWEWQAGWYLIQYEYGLLSREEVPVWVSSVLPPEVVPDDLVSNVLFPSGGCVDFGGGVWVDFGSGYFLPATYMVLPGAGCTGIPFGVLGNAAVFAPPGFDALTLCNLNGTFTSAPLNFNNTYICQI